MRRPMLPGWRPIPSRIPDPHRDPSRGPWHRTAPWPPQRASPPASGFPGRGRLAPTRSARTARGTGPPACTRSRGSPGSAVRLPRDSPPGPPRLPSSRVRRTRCPFAPGPGAARDSADRTPSPGSDRPPPARPRRACATGWRRLPSRLGLARSPGLPRSTFGLRACPPAEGEASESRRRADHETDVVLLLPDRPALLERLPSRLLVEIPEREDARAVEGSRPGDGPRPRSGRREGLRQPRSRFFRVPAFLLEQPQVRRELERVGSSAVIEEPGKRGPERLVFLLETLHPGRVGRPPQVRLRLRCDCEKPFGAVCLLSVPRHVIPA